MKFCVYDISGINNYNIFISYKVKTEFKLINVEHIDIFKDIEKLREACK